MSLSKRGKIVVGAGAAALALIVGVVAYSLVTGQSPLAAAVNVLPGHDDPPACPLTGAPAPHGKIPERPVAAVKVENTADAYPQAGLDHADIVYEELVEGGITRFIVLFQCTDAKRVGPVRSARTTDPGILLQYGRPILAFSGGAKKVVKIVDRSGLHAVDETTGGEAFVRDPGRVDPHNLFVNVPKLRKVAKDREKVPPDPMFSYGEYDGKSRKAGSVTMAFSSLNEVAWRWSRRADAYTRVDNGQASTLEAGEPIAAKNVIVQFVKVTESDIHDVTGSPSPEVTLTGAGKAYVLRDGRVIPGTWKRASLSQTTTFTTKDGSDIPLVPGQTWIELYPARGGFTDASFEIAK